MNISLNERTRQAAIAAGLGAALLLGVAMPATAQDGTQYDTVDGEPPNIVSLEGDAVDGPAPGPSLEEIEAAQYDTVDGEPPNIVPVDKVVDDAGVAGQYDTEDGQPPNIVPVDDVVDGPPPGPSLEEIERQNEEGSGNLPESTTPEATTPPATTPETTTSKDNRSPAATPRTAPEATTAPRPATRSTGDELPATGGLTGIVIGTVFIGLGIVAYRITRR